MTSWPEWLRKIFLDNGNEFQPLQSVYGQKIITKQNHPWSNWGKIKGKNKAVEEDEQEF